MAVSTFLFLSFPPFLGSPLNMQIFNTQRSAKYTRRDSEEYSVYNTSFTFQSLQEIKRQNIKFSLRHYTEVYILVFVICN